MISFAENNRISHCQLRRQIVLAYLGPLLLCLTGRGGIQGMNGLLGLLTALFTFLLDILILIRLYPAFGNLEKAAGGFWGRIVGLFFLSYVVFSGAVLLSVLEEILPMGLLTGVPAWQNGLLAALVCSVGIHRGIQRRGRIAQVTGGFLLLGVVLMLILSLKQGNPSYVKDMLSDASSQGFFSFGDWYGGVCAFAGLTLLPFSLKFVEKRNSAGRSIAAAIGVLGAVYTAVIFILPSVLGWERVRVEKYPIFPLLAGTDLPGNVLARFDIVWMCFLLFGLLFSIGSLFFYGSHILQSSGLGNGRFWVPALAFILSLDLIPGWSLRGFYSDYVALIFVPGAALIQLLMLMKNTGKRMKAAGAAAALVLMISLTGCAGVEPEKRLFPLAIAVDYTDDGLLEVTYAMADMKAETGQDKPEESGSQTVLKLKAHSFDEIRSQYERSQEKYLDLGHLQALILGKAMLEDRRYDAVLKYLLEESMTGEDLYLFVTEDVDAVVNYEGAKESSIGEYLKGIYENRPSGQRQKGTDLRTAYAYWYKYGVLMELPEIIYDGGDLLFI
ncbi:MAG: GerAB/ArcD/ProY family transporter [Eubacteriales bacterium]|nr:GerAB/ArcD/ProY family transporter [Eubacteriales bacterium]